MRCLRLQVGDMGAAVPGESGQHCVVDWWGGGCAAGVHWSDVALVHPFQAWMSLPAVRHARECLERAAAALQLEREKCADKEEELWAGYKKFVRRFGGGEGAFLWLNRETEAGPYTSPLFSST